MAQNGDAKEIEALTGGKQIEDGEDEKPNEKTKRGWEYYLRYVSLVVLVVQNTGQVLLTRYATRRDQEQFIKTVAVFFNEVIKLIAGTILFLLSTGDIKKAASELKLHFCTHWLETLKVGVPAFIYTIQNFLLYLSIEHLDAGTYMVTYQLKILTTALFTVLMLKRKLSLVQWGALATLAIGVAVVQTSAGKGASPAAVLNGTLITTTAKPINKAAEQQPLIGFTAVVAAAIMSGFAGIYFEKILKGSEVSIWLRNIQLSVLSIPISLVVIAIKDREKVLNRGFLAGFDYVVWSVVLCQALGGLIVAVVIKYADNILKAFATSIAIIVACLASIVLFNTFPTALFLVGAFLVIGAVVLYSVFPYKPKYHMPAEDVKMDALGEQDETKKEEKSQP
ncbi:unnamed protein product [Bursaphelenchus xylophilus]|uniref:(pine wood nematode) hypothetical protein n=1 Tax=Bursaphelenchus xylophilus TaxID=6326 RepID=A0A1I7RHQ5_BURXY|nr:unnamed protein product [Bursaphelenchus xylophilus]CAG9115491.1 unnamed protein product [Bursaphelenchus xylophilus]